MNSINRSKIYYISIIGVSLLFFIAGYFYFYSCKLSNNTNIINILNEFTQNLCDFRPKNLLLGIGFLSISTICSFIFFGPIIYIIFGFYQFFSFGFTTGAIIATFKFSSFPFVLIYNILYLIIPSLIAFILILYLLKIIKYFLKKIILKKNEILSTKFNIYLKRSFVLYLIYCFYNLIIFFFGGKILNLIAFFN